VEINIYAAKSQLSQLIRRVTAGEEVVITRNGEPVARLVPVARAAVARRLGTLAGSIRIGDDFDAPLPDEILDAFEGKA
jgi:prevent-host-death family protein